MNAKHKLKNRALYLDKLITFKDTEPVKVVTGIRRCGKSSLLALMAQHLEDNGISKSQIVEMNFESYNYKDFTSDEIYSFVKGKATDGRMYLFFDEIQRVERWEEAINALRVDFDCDIYVTGSNAYLLSSEYATYLSGRCIEIKMQPLSFSEFISFNDLEVQVLPSVLGGERKFVTDREGTRYSLLEVFESYMKFGGFPDITEVGLSQEKAFTLLEGVYSTVVLRDIMQREMRRGRRQITDSLLLKKIILFLCDNIGSNVSATSIGKTLVNEGLLADEHRKGRPSAHTVQAYIEALTEAYLFYETKRFDIKGREMLKTLGKYYVVDIGLRNYLLGTRDRDRGYALENIVYLELLRRGYDVAIGKLDNMEIDFIATKADERLYVQVTESMANINVRERELAPLKKLSDNYEKIILSLDSTEGNYEGIKQINLENWLLS